MENCTILILPTVSFRDNHDNYSKELSIAAGCLIPVYIFCMRIFSKCSRLAKTVKFWYQHVLVSNLMSFIFLIISRLLKTESLDTYEGEFYKFFDGLFRTGQFSGLVCAFTLGCDQLLSLLFATRHQPFTTTRRLWACAAFIHILSFIASLTVYYGKDEFYRTHEIVKTTRAAAWTSCLIMLTFSAFTFLVFFTQGCIALHKKRNVSSASFIQQNDYSRFIKTAIKFFILGALYALGDFVPAIIDLVCLVLGRCPDFIEKLGFVRVILILLLYSGLPISLISSTYESRYIFLVSLCRCRSNYRQLEARYKQRYASYVIATNNRPAVMNYGVTTQQQADVSIRANVITEVDSATQMEVSLQDSITSQAGRTTQTGMATKPGELTQSEETTQPGETTQLVDTTPSEVIPPVVMKEDKVTVEAQVTTLSGIKKNVGENTLYEIITQIDGIKTLVDVHIHTS